MESKISGLVGQLSELSYADDIHTVYHACQVWYARESIKARYGDEAISLLDDFIKQGWEVSLSPISGQGSGVLCLEKDDKVLWPPRPEDFIQQYGHLSQLLILALSTYASMVNPHHGSYD